MNPRTKSFIAPSNIPPDLVDEYLNKLMADWLTKNEDGRIDHTVAIRRHDFNTVYITYKANYAFRPSARLLELANNQGSVQPVPQGSGLGQTVGGEGLAGKPSAAPGKAR